MYNSETFRKFIVVCNHHHNPIFKWFISSPTTFTFPFAVYPCSHSQASETALLLSVPVILSILDISYKMESYSVQFFCLGSLDQHNIFDIIYVSAYFINAFIFVAEYHCISWIYHILFAHSLIDKFRVDSNFKLI